MYRQFLAGLYRSRSNKIEYLCPLLFQILLIAITVRSFHTVCLRFANTGQSACHAVLAVEDGALHFQGPANFLHGPARSREISEWLLIIVAPLGVYLMSLSEALGISAPSLVLLRVSPPFLF